MTALSPHASIALMQREPGESTQSHLGAPRGPIDREQILDRLQSLREMLPAFAQEAASARRHAARLRVENRRLHEQVRRLQRERSGSVSVAAAASPSLEREAGGITLPP